MEHRGSDDPTNPPSQVASQSPIVAGQSSAPRNTDLQTDLLYDQILSNEEPIGGFLYVAIPWLCLLAGGTAFVWFQIRTVLSDPNTMNSLEQTGLYSLIKFLRIANITNGILLILAAMLLVSMFQAIRPAPRDCIPSDQRDPRGRRPSDHDEARGRVCRSLPGRRSAIPASEARGQTDRIDDPHRPLLGFETSRQDLQVSHRR